MHWSNIGLILIAGFDLAVAFIALLINKKHIINRLFFLSHFGLAGWSFELAMFREASNIELAWFWAIVQNLFSGTAFIPFLVFTVYFPYQRYILLGWQKVGLALITISLLLMTFMPGWWIASVVLHNHDNIFQLNPYGHWYFSIIFFLFIGLGLYNLFSKFVSTGGFSRRRLTTF